MYRDVQRVFLVLSMAAVLFVLLCLRPNIAFLLGFAFAVVGFCVMPLPPTKKQQPQHDQQQEQNGPSKDVNEVDGRTSEGGGVGDDVGTKSIAATSMPTFAAAAAPAERAAELHPPQPRGAMETIVIVHNGLTEEGK